MHERSLARVERVAGAGSARVVDAIVAPAFRSAPVQADARRALGLPVEGPIAVISGGGWAVGRVEAALTAAIAVDGLTVVVLTGKNELLRRRLEERVDENGRVRVVPFTARMPELLTAADVLVDSTLGVTCLEALSAGCRLIAFGVPPGHSRDNARALTALALADTPRRSSELTELLAEVACRRSRMPELLPAAESSTAAILNARARVEPAKSRRPAIVATAATVATLAFTGWTFASPTPYPLVARAFDLGGLHEVETRQPDVALVIDAPQSLIPQLARTLARRGVHASFAVPTAPSVTLLRTVTGLHDGVLPATSAGGATGILGFRKRLVVVAKALDARGRFYYLRPRSGFTLADYLAAREAGGLPVSASDDLQLADLHAGAIVRVAASRSQARDSLTTALALLWSRHLRAVRLEELLASASRA